MKSGNRNLLVTGPLVLVLTVCAIGWVIYQQASKLPQQLRAEIRADYLKSKKNDLKGHIRLAENAIKHLREPDLEISIEEAKKEAKKILSNLKYSEEDGYFFVYDFSGKSIVHPIKKDWVNQNKWDYKDKEGKYVIRDLITTARKAARGEGDGFDEYIFHKPSVADDIADRSKLAFVIELTDWEWVLGTGIYLEDVDNFLDGTDTEVLNYIHISMIWIAGIAFIGMMGLSLSQRNIGKTLERLRIGADLHDQVKQDLAYIIRELNNQLHQPGEVILSNSREFLEKIRDPAQHALDWIRIIIAGKDPNNLILIDGLGELKRNFEMREQVPVTFSKTHKAEAYSKNLSKEKKAAILKVVNEALSNIRHAAATRVDLQLQTDECNIALTIQDNGVGFDVNHVKSVRMGLGLGSMEARIRRIGGELTIESSDCGTTVKVTLPQNHNLWSYMLCLLKHR